MSRGRIRKNWNPRVFDSLKDHAIGTLDLDVATRVGDRGVVDVDSVVLTEIPKGGPCEGRAQVGNDPIRYTEVVCYVLHEFCCFFRCYFRNRLDFNPLVEFIDG
jgi:hypothetical protein